MEQAAELTKVFTPIPLTVFNFLTPLPVTVPEAQEILSGPWAQLSSRLNVEDRKSLLGRPFSTESLLESAPEIETLMSPGAPEAFMKCSVPGREAPLLVHFKYLEASNEVDILLKSPNIDQHTSSFFSFLSYLFAN